VRTRPLPPSHRKRDLWIAATAVVVAWAALALPIDLADLLALPAGVARVFREMYPRRVPTGATCPMP
jgi:hypothetical protein